MANFLQICLNVPNLGTLVFFLIFVLAIPATLISAEQYDSLKYYLPALVMMASTLTESGKPRYFDTLYPPVPDTATAWLSKNFINLLAVIGIMLNSIVVSMSTGSVLLGLVTSIIAFMITFPVGGSIVPFFIRYMDELLKARTTFRYPGNWHKYFTGFVFIVLFMTLQVILLRQANNIVLASQAGVV